MAVGGHDGARGDVGVRQDVLLRERRGGAHHRLVEGAQVGPVAKAVLLEGGQALVLGMPLLVEEAEQPDGRQRVAVSLGAGGQQALADLRVLRLAEDNLAGAQQVVLGLLGEERQRGHVLAVEQERPAGRVVGLRLGRGQVEQRVVVVDDARRRVGELLAGGGERELVGVADEQLAAQLLLELAHGAAHALGRDEVELGGLGDGLGLGHVQEVVQVLDVHGQPPSRLASPRRRIRRSPIVLAGPSRGKAAAPPASRSPQRPLAPPPRIVGAAGRVFASFSGEQTRFCAVLTH